jgi:hypothetical protein
MKTALTQDRLKQLLDYSLETGVFKWKIANSNRIKIGNVAGSPSPKGYLLIGIDGCVYRAHRLAWMYVYGKFPENFIDHVNGIVTDNRIENLRDVDNRTNGENQRRATKQNKSSGVLGVSREQGHKRWRAHIGVNGKQVHLGYFDTIEEASDAYITAKRKIHQGCSI